MRTDKTIVKDVYRDDYRISEFLINQVELDCEIFDKFVSIKSKLYVQRNSKSGNKNSPLRLDGENQNLISVSVNGIRLKKNEFELTKHSLSIFGLSNSAIIEIISTHNPYKNLELSGFYSSGPMLSTQCEPEGFRRITYYLDRPDVMAKFKVTMHSDKRKYPVLLSNGNLIKTGNEKNGRHFATWEDPHLKPCYLFAMVAGKFDKVMDYHKTKSGKKVKIEIYVEPGRKKETHLARAAIKKAMKWDEEVFGLEYDLDRFMMVATPYFNFGAMENKGLNIFNDSCVLGNTETVTDSTISFIERVVGHEYFHNWTGNRITCRDWFQLSLKEGLTVFREQEFMGDLNSTAVERLSNVRNLRRVQFAEDSGAMSHPVRPFKYRTIDNFYTATVYEKGAELVRMLKTICGDKGFYKGFQLYIKRHDGQAVTCDDFVKAMADANKLDLRSYMGWYNQAGTPHLIIQSKYKSKSNTLDLKIQQKTLPTPGQKNKYSLPIPLAVGLLDPMGKDMFPTKILNITQAKQSFKFRNIRLKPTLSLLRNFSSPVNLAYAQQTQNDLLFLMAHDSDAYNRWNAGHRLITQYLLARIGGKLNLQNDEDNIILALKEILIDDTIDEAFKSMVFTLPSEGELGLSLRASGKLIDIESIYKFRRDLFEKIAHRLNKELQICVGQLKGISPSSTDGRSMGKRSLRNILLSYIAVADRDKILSKIYHQATSSKNMTDTLAALSILIESKSPLKIRALKLFESRWKNCPAVMDKWFAVQSSEKTGQLLGTVRKLMSHPAFNMQNPNRVSSLIGVFANNGLAFHNLDGSGYEFLSGVIKTIDAINPHSASSLAKSFVRWKDYDHKRQRLMHKQLRKLSSLKNLSKNVREIVDNSLKN